MKKLSSKQLKFKKVLSDAKKALDEAGIPFHLHSGTALGSQREGTFIEHDDDIDLGVFIRDYKRSLVTYMKKHGFELEAQYGKLKFGKEYCFRHIQKNVRLDIFMVYESMFEHKPIYWVSSVFGKCNDMKYGMCRWKYRPYIPALVNIAGIDVYAMPVSALEDGYGPNWRVPKKFDYFGGLEEGYTNLIKEYK